MPSGMEHQSFSVDGLISHLTRGTNATLHIGGSQIQSQTRLPGWRWSDDEGADSSLGAMCPAAHFQYHVSGRMGIKFADGTEVDAGPGDVTLVPPSHDAWVIGDEPVVVIDWCDATVYATRA